MSSIDIKLKHGLWIVVADGEKALLLRNKGDTKFPDFEVIREMEQANPATREQGTERPGRHSDGPSAHNSAYEETDWHRLNKERFANDVADLLYKLAHRSRFEELVIIAPPPILGEMRKHLHDEVVSRVTAEIPKTLTNHTVFEIEELLKGA
ncbi:host attachment protein [Pseudaminobacter arsenicus]|uniref:Host attachment protein n=1 Tax=Borborobacter arsenicus TaxID=1851146 RepID=A0A432V5P9_9HYPH|nr:host attachment family protein [Pseudaminobacter arsenicus]RUM97475.1 host attachment protein [Pseudaminobacter arsenicus]